jgi:hypothetical protein
MSASRFVAKPRERKGVTKGDVCDEPAVNSEQNTRFELGNCRTASEYRSGPGLAECLLLLESSRYALVDVSGLESEECRKAR